MAQYGKIEYWNQRYAVDREPFDWYQRYSGIRHFFTEEYLAHDPATFPSRNELRVLVIGCGNSRMSEEMVEDGFASVTSIDFSDVVIEQMRSNHPNSKYEVMDATKPFSYADDSFDLIVCKGTMDAILCGAGSINSAKTMLMECSRVLGDNGALVVVSYGTPENRMVYFESKEFAWTVDVHTVPKPRIGVPSVEDKEASGDHYVYICRKGTAPEPVESIEADVKSEDHPPPDDSDGASSKSPGESKSSADCP